MITFAARRRWGIGTLAAVSLLSIGVYNLYSLSLIRTTTVTGWTLFAALVTLTVYNVRKKVPFLPLLRSSTWLQFHIYLGYFTAVLLLLHVEFRLPNGWFELLLLMLFLAVFLSGVTGLVLSRTIPYLLSQRGEEVIYERIPIFREELRRKLESLILSESAKSELASISGFYRFYLVRFFAGPRNFWLHLFQSTRHRNDLMSHLEGLQRYMNDEEQAIAETVVNLIEVKDHLDYNHAHQTLLKYWLFVHIPLTYSLLIVALVHGLLVHAFFGGLW